MARAGHRDRREAPMWIAQRWGWGPLRWPIYWCQAVRAEILDCGALSELAFEALRDGPNVWLKVQLVQQCTPLRLAHWRASWQRAGADCSWIREPYAYHEVVGLLGDVGLEIWDPADGLWKGSGQTGHRGIVAIRPVLPHGGSSAGLPAALTWDRWILQPNRWNQVSAHGSEETARPAGPTGDVHRIGTTDEHHTL